MGIIKTLMQRPNLSKLTSNEVKHLLAFSDSKTTCTETKPHLIQPISNLPLHPASLNQLPTSKGIYVLIFQANTAATVTIGKLGQLQVQLGYYFYIGSARGAGGIAARIKHHQRPRPMSNPRWHIDYLPARLQAVWISETLKECECVAALLQYLPDTQRAMANFGASDCRCGGHLLYSTIQPQKEE